MIPDLRVRTETALLPALLAAYPPGEYVGQESFVRASEVIELATRAGIGPGTSVLDVCCGVAGPGRLIAYELQCSYLGVDRSPEAIAVARHRAPRSCRFEVAQVPPLPPGEFDVVVLLETLLAFSDKATLLRAVSSALGPGGRFAFTVEEGAALSEAERRAMPASDTVWPVPWAELVTQLDAVGLGVVWRSDHTREHQATVSRLVHEFTARYPELRSQIGGDAFDELVTGHRLWSDWLRTGRVRKFAVVARKDATVN